jgi:hypothetical protein
VGAETSLELIPRDGVDICIGIAIRLPPVSCCPMKLVGSKKDLIAIPALGDHEFLLDPLKPILCIHGVFGLREGGGASSQELRQTRLVRWWRWGYLLLVWLHAVEGLQHGLPQLSLGGEQLLQVSVVVVVVVVVVAVVVAELAVALAVPCVHHLMVWEKGRMRFHVTQLYAQGIWGKCCHFIYLNIDEVGDKVPEHPTTLTNTHKHKHQSSNKR